MKRALLIAGGTVGGLGAVLAITPPQLGSTSAINIAGAPATGTGTTAVASASSSSSATAKTTASAAGATKAAKPVATKKASSSNSGTNNSAATTAPATAAATTAPAAINGTFTGPSVFVNYGNVQVKITVVNGRITDAVAVVDDEADATAVVPVPVTGAPAMLIALVDPN